MENIHFDIIFINLDNKRGTESLLIISFYKKKESSMVLIKFSAMLYLDNCKAYQMCRIYLRWFSI